MANEDKRIPALPAGGVPSGNWMLAAYSVDADTTFRISISDILPNLGDPGPVWDAGTTYDAGEVTSYSQGPGQPYELWISNDADNMGHIPGPASTFWTAVSRSSSGFVPWSPGVYTDQYVAVVYDNKIYWLDIGVPRPFNSTDIDAEIIAEYWVSLSGDIEGITMVSGTSPIQVATGSTTPVVSILPASGSQGGYITDAAQTIAGAKTFSATIIGNISGSANSAASATALAVARIISATGDATGSAPAFDGSADVAIPLTLATVNGNVGSFGSTTQVPVITVNGKGLITGVSLVTVATSGTAWQLSGTFTPVAPIADGSYFTWQNNAIGGSASATTGIKLENNTAATSVLQQVSPALTFKGFGWKTSGTPASRSVEFRIFNEPTLSSVNPIGILHFQSSVNGGAFADCFRVSSAGNMEIQGTLKASLAAGAGVKVLIVEGIGNAEQFSVTQEGLATIAQTSGGIRIKEGTNASMGVATMVAGTVTVNNTRVTANSRIFPSVKTPGGTQGHLSFSVVAGVSFTINSTSATETSTLDWLIIEPAP